MKKLLVAAIMVVLATPAFAAIQNVKVSGDITTTFVDRNNFDLGLTDQTEYNFNGGSEGSPDSSPAGLKHQAVVITQTRVRVDADLSDNVSTTVGLINERAWNTENTPQNHSSNPQLSASSQNVSNLDTNVQLYLASLTLREFLYSPLTLTIGRQDFGYGNGLILGVGGVNNQGTGNLQYIAQDLTERTEYDGVKATLDYKPLSIDLIYFKNNQLVLNGNPASGKTSSDVFGYDATYQLSDPMSTLLETYFFSRINGHNNNTAFDAGNSLGNGSAISTDKGDTLFVPGLRASTNPIKGLNVQGEVAWQLGNQPVGTGNGQLSERREAMAAQFMASYALPVLDKYKPSVNGAFTYVSGDKNASGNYNSDHLTSSKTFSAWDPFNESQGSGTIYNTLFPLSNMEILAVGASVNPLEDVTTAFTWSSLWAADSYSAQNPLAIYQPDGGATQLFPATKKDEKGLGNEYDVNITYNYTEDVTFGLSLGWYVPGTALSSSEANGGINNGTASQALADVNVKF
jgi:flavodoxin